MRASLLVLSFLLLFSAPVVNAKTVSLDGGRITFDAPEGFKRLPKEVLDLKYLSSRAPKYVIGNDTAGTSIAYDIKDNYIPEEELEQGRQLFVKMLGRLIPGIKWKEKKLIEKNGRTWIYLEMTSTAIDTDIHNIMLITPYKGKLLMFNFNSTKEEFKTYEKALRKSIKSIKVAPKNSESKPDPAPAR